jgi:hypothetical protein
VVFWRHSLGMKVLIDLQNPSLPDVNGQILKGRVTKDSHFPFARGGNSNIFRGRFTRSDGRKIRVCRVSSAVHDNKD